MTRATDHKFLIVRLNIHESVSSLNTFQNFVCIWSLLITIL